MGKPNPAPGGGGGNVKPPRVEEIHLHLDSPVTVNVTVTMQGGGSADDTAKQIEQIKTAVEGITAHLKLSGDALTTTTAGNQPPTT